MAYGASGVTEILPRGSVLSDWDGTLPAVLVIQGASPNERRGLLKTLAARVLGVEPARVEVEHRAQTAPALLRPADEGLFLSSASRDEWAAVAVARVRIGVDLEIVDAAGEVPWNVLHPVEAHFLRSLEGDRRARAFARLWSVKEAYVKALRSGPREAESFAVRLPPDDETALIDDPLIPVRAADARTAWRSIGDRRVAVSVVTLPTPASRGQVPSGDAQAVSFTTAGNTSSQPR